jgi:hypothetical protein
MLKHDLAVALVMLVDDDVRRPASLLPFCYPTALYAAGQGSIWQRPMLENEQLIETYWYGLVREVTAVAELRMR